MKKDLIQATHFYRLWTLAIILMTASAAFADNHGQYVNALERLRAQKVSVDILLSPNAVAQEAEEALKRVKPTMAEADVKATIQAATDDYAANQMALDWWTLTVPAFSDKLTVAQLKAIADKADQEPLHSALIHMDDINSDEASAQFSKVTAKALLQIAVGKEPTPVKPNKNCPVGYVSAYHRYYIAGMGEHGFDSIEQMIKELVVEKGGAIGNSEKSKKMLDSIMAYLHGNLEAIMMNIAFASGISEADLKTVASFMETPDVATLSKVQMAHMANLKTLNNQMMAMYNDFFLKKYGVDLEFRAE